ncbi:hypothetical protein GW915_03700 [bacterium]|nr:hypothetical protein [bacterium]
MSFKKSKSGTAIPRQTTKASVQVMYQNLQGSWYAFADIDGEIYFAKVPVQYAVEKNDAKALEVIKKSRSKAA